MKIKILYEDKDILVIEKPSGVTVHPDGRQSSKKKEEFITEWILKNYPATKNVGESMFFEGVEIKKPGIVHRLDRETSGVLLLAKTKKAYEFLKEQFQNREIKKTYVTVVDGWMREDRGVINKPIGRSPSDFRRRSAGRGARGELKEAITRYKVLKRFTAPAHQNFSSSSHLEIQDGSHAVKNFDMPSLNKFTYLEIYPKTGRTHQIRVHMKYLNHPVLCDELYNPDGSCPKELKRLALHAKSIEFKNLKGEVIKIESPIPKEILNIVK